MIRSETLKRYIDFAYSAYQEHNVTNQAYRQDGRVPYLTHPLGAASLLIADTDLPYEVRELGFKILILHDVLEDTSLSLPDWVEPVVKDGVLKMTHVGSYEDAKKSIREGEVFIQLLTLYDAFWSLYEKHVGVQKRSDWKNGVLDLANIIEQHYGSIRIVQIARTVAGNTDW